MKTFFRLPYRASSPRRVKRTAHIAHMHYHTPQPGSSAMANNNNSTPKMADSPVMTRPKKLIVCCDGTWMDSDSGWEPPSYNPLDWHPQGRLQTPSNVSRISHLIKPVDERDNHPQIIYYQAGVGTGWSLSDHVIGGGTGKGIAQNIREAYTFLANNYTEGDYIFLLGFSRGAFTARSIGGLIGDFGLVNKSTLPLFHNVFEDWENAGSKTYTPSLPKRMDGSFSMTTKCENKDAYLKEYREKLDAAGMTTGVKITAIGVWDTVGSLGMPTMPWLQKLGVPTTLHVYRFFDTNLGNHVENAFQALALDEHRSPFSPTLWERTRTKDWNTNLKQVWFPGVHANVGGGYPDTELSDITLAWMMSQLNKWIDFEDAYIANQLMVNKKGCAEQKTTEVQWAKGLITESAKGVTAIVGKKRRTPGCYTKVDYDTGLSTGELLENTNEYIHASVRARVNYKGANYDDEGTYDPWAASSRLPPPLEDWANPGGALLEWRLHDGSHDQGGPVQGLYYEYVGTDEKVKQRRMYEDELGKYEKMLLKKNGGIAEEVLASNAAAMRPSTSS